MRFSAKGIGCGLAAALIVGSLGACEKPEVKVEVDGKEMDVAKVKIDGDAKKIEIEGKDGKVTVSGDGKLEVTGEDGAIKVKADGEDVEVEANDEMPGGDEGEEE